jgi:hypothetical protein
VRRGRSFPAFRIVAVAALALFALIAVTLSVHRYRQPQAAPPEALAHIAEKNRDAAIDAAARQRAESAASTNAAESLAEARGRRDANDVLARFPNTDNRSEAAGRRD